MAPDASGKLAISIAPATARSSSSQSSKLSWQPSQDANFQTANFGRRAVAISNLRNSKDRSDPVESKHRPVLAHERRSVLAVPAESHRAFHIAFHGEIHLAG